MSAPLVLLDAASLWFRSFYALPESVTAPDGTPVNAVRGFTDAVAKILTDRRPARLVACLDADWRPAFRVAALPSYKAHRVAGAATGTAEALPHAEAATSTAEALPHAEAATSTAEEEVPDTLTGQVPVILDLLDAMGLATAEAAGYEADDVIGTLAAMESADPVEVVTGDRDLFQTVRAEPTPVRVIYVGRGLAKAEVFGPAELAQRYGLPVARAGASYADMAALRGDPSDGLPGVAGIGEKTAAKLISTFGSLEALSAAAEEGDPRLPTRARAAVLAAADYLAAAAVVVRVVTDTPISWRGSDGVPAVPRVPERVAELQRRWGLGRSVDRLVAALALRAG